MNRCTVIVIVAVVVAALIVPSAGCRREPVKVYAAVDTSGSADRDRQERINTLYLLVQYVLPGNATLSIWSFTREAIKRWEGQPESAEAIVDIGRRLLPSSGEEGTFPGELLSALLTDLQQQQGARDVYLVLLWDGDNDRGESLAPKITQLASAPRVKGIWIMGVADDNRTTVEREFAPLGDRLIVTGMADRQDGMDKFAAMLQ